MDVAREPVVELPRRLIWDRAHSGQDRLPESLASAHPTGRGLAHASQPFETRLSRDWTADAPDASCLFLLVPAAERLAPNWLRENLTFSFPLDGHGCRAQNCRLLFAKCFRPCYSGHKHPAHRHGLWPRPGHLRHSYPRTCSSSRWSRDIWRIPLLPKAAGAQAAPEWLDRAHAHSHRTRGKRSCLKRAAGFAAVTPSPWRARRSGRQNVAGAVSVLAAAPSYVPGRSPLRGA